MIIGLMGNARTGKDTFANYLVTNYGFVRIGLADPLKRFCKEVFDFTDEQLYGDKRDEPDKRYPRGEKVIGKVTKSAIPGLAAGSEFVKTEYLTPRYALQTLGTEWGRNCYNNIWIETGIRTAQKLLSGETAGYTAEGGLRYTDGFWKRPTGVVFSDLRFRNEFDAVRKADGKMVRIYRPDKEGKDLAGVANHPSEEEQRSIRDDEFDLIIHNDSTLDSYYTQIKHTMKVLRR